VSDDKTIIQGRGKADAIANLIITGETLPEREQLKSAEPPPPKRPPAIKGEKEK